MAKPVGPICNLNCTYCYYLEKEKLYPRGVDFRMSPEVLEAFIRDYISLQDSSEVSMVWQGGEPTLIGLNFFESVVALQKKYANGRIVRNAIQTNGTRLDDAWCRFFKANHFLVGVSIDGPPDLHDVYRLDKGGQPTLDSVMAGITLLKQYGVEFNTLTVVSATNVKHPLKIYEFLKDQGSGFLQFIPLVERELSGVSEKFAPPPESGESPREVTPWSVPPVAYGEFLCTIFDHWVRHDVGNVFVQIFDVALGIWSGQGSSLCVFQENCGRALALEHNGDLYSCDHYVYPKFHLGNLLNKSLGAMVESPRQQEFGQAKSATLPKYCLQCEVRFACNGECPKHRFAKTPDGEEGLNHLCEAYKKFFTHIDKPMRAMSALLRSGRPPADIMRYKL
jgi:uncharacterized protein